MSEHPWPGFCGNCRYYRPNGATAIYGRCIRRSPTAMPVNGATFPEVRVNDACAEFVERPKSWAKAFTDGIKIDREYEGQPR